MLGFFRENSDLSMMRLSCFICVLTACGLAFTNVTDKTVVIGILLASGVGGKVFQKSKEQKNGND
jgi:hypothetical protein